MDDQLQQLRERIIRTVIRRAAAAFAGAFSVVHAIGMLRTDGASIRSLIAGEQLGDSILIAQLLVLIWVGTSFLLNPLGGRYLRVLATTPMHLRPAEPRPEGRDRVTSLGLPGLRAVATLADEAATVEVFQTADAKVTVLLEGDGLTALSRLDDGRILYSSDLMVVPCNQVVVNLKPAANALDVMTSHLRLSAKLASVGRTVVADSAQIALELLVLERRSLAAIGPVAATFLGLHGGAGPHRLLVAPTRAELLRMGLRYRQSPSEMPREQSSVASTDFSSNNMMVSVASS
ncbi:MAG: hypothetical protein R2706_07005 [Acidimicrobiales bacterium]